MASNPKPSWGRALAAAGAVELAGEPAIEVTHRWPRIFRRRTVAPASSPGTGDWSDATTIDDPYDTSVTDIS